MVPGQEPYHWQRGLVHYYAGKYKAGRKQFEVHQTVNTQDVENAVWHYLCVAKTDGVAEAEKHFIKITSDRRVPLKQIHALFAGKGTEQQVLDAIKAGDPAPGALARNQFYGHLYLGLYFESQGTEEKAAKYIALAAKGHESHGYMGQVARVHHEWLQQKPREADQEGVQIVPLGQALGLLRRSDRRFAQQLGQNRLHRNGPRSVAFRVGMGAVRDQVAPHAAAVEERLTDIRVVHPLAIADVLDQPVYFHVDLPRPVVVVATAREDAHTKHLGFRQLGA